MEVDSNASVNPVYREKIDSSSIRLLRLAASEDGTFTGKLRKFELADAPHFYSASYTWGTRTYSDTTIEFKIGRLPILEGLLPFLRMISKHADFSDHTWWWIDSLCINLADGQEREQQVRIMADIYRKATRAMVWLGDEVEIESDCRGAIDFLNYLRRLQPLFNGQNADDTRATLRSPDLVNCWASVANLLNRPWWTRVWTLQEMILPREVKFYCGNTSISRGKFKTAMYCIFLCSVGDRDMDVELVPRKVFDTAFNRRRVHQWYVKPKALSLVAVLAYLGNHCASDPRDRIYSVLGLITARDRRLVGDPEYKTSVRSQYARLVRSFYNEYHSLDIICFSHLFNRYSGPEDPGIETAMPSWVPDWRVYTEFASPVPLMASQSANEHIGNFRPLHGQKWKAIYDAPGKWLRGRANVRFHQNLRDLWCDGILLDTVENLGSLESCEPRCRSFVCVRDEPLHGPIYSSTRTQVGNAIVSEPVAFLSSIARSLVLDRQDKYLRFVAPDHYISDFLVVCTACLDPETLPDASEDSLDPNFVIWFQQNRQMCLGPCTLEQLVRIVISATNAARLNSLPPPTIQVASLSSRLATSFTSKVDAESDFADTFFSRFLDTTRKKSRRLMVTSEGYIGMAPCRARPGDAVVVLFGCSIPLILRREGPREEWQLVGEAYVDGFMNGEARRLIKEGTRSIRRFRMV